MTIQDTANDLIADSRSRFIKDVDIEEVTGGLTSEGFDALILAAVTAGAEIEQDTGALERQVSNLTRQLADARRNIDNCNQSMNELGRAYETQTAQLDATVARARQAAAQHVQREAQLERALGLVEESDKRLSQTKQDLSEAQDKVKELSNGQGRLKAALSRSQATVKQLQAKLDDATPKSNVPLPPASNEVEIGMWQSKAEDLQVRMAQINALSHATK